MNIPRTGILLLHIPDGFLSTPIAFIGWLMAALIISLVIRNSREEITERQMPLLGVIASFIFAAQAINFPVAGGTSGHLMGAALAAIILGPWSGVIVMTSVVTLQALIFQDGGLLAMGWNIFNMAILTTITSAAVYGLVRRVTFNKRSALILGGGLAAWLSVEAAAMATAFQLAASETAPLFLSLASLLGVHALIGLGEAVITVGALLLVWRVRPDLLRLGQRSTNGPGTHIPWIAAVFASALLIIGLSFFASGLPDGLERFAIEEGFSIDAVDPLFSVMPGYIIPWIEESALAGVLAIAAGTFLVFILFLVLSRFFGQPAQKTDISQEN